MNTLIIITIMVVLLAAVVFFTQVMGNWILSILFENGAGVTDRKRRIVFTAALLFVIVVLFGLWCIIQTSSYSDWSMFNQKSSHSEEEKKGEVQVIITPPPRQSSATLVNPTPRNNQPVDCSRYRLPAPTNVFMEMENGFYKNYNTILKWDGHQLSQIRGTLACALRVYFSERTRARGRSIEAYESVLEFSTPADWVPEEDNQMDRRFGKYNIEFLPDGGIMVHTVSNIREKTITESSCAGIQIPYDDNDPDERNKMGQCYLLFSWIVGGDDEITRNSMYGWSCGSTNDRLPTVVFCNIPDLKFLRNSLKFQEHALVSWKRPREQLLGFPHFRGLSNQIQNRWIATAEEAIRLDRENLF